MGKILQFTKVNKSEIDNFIKEVVKDEIKFKVSYEGFVANIEISHRCFTTNCSSMAVILDCETAEDDLILDILVIISIKDIQDNLIKVVNTTISELLKDENLMKSKINETIKLCAINATDTAVEYVYSLL